MGGGQWRAAPKQTWDRRVPEVVPWSGRWWSPPAVTSLPSHPGTAQGQGQKGGWESDLLVTPPRSSLSRAGLGES